MKIDHLDQALVDAAVALLERRFAGRGGIAAAMYTSDGTLLTSVNFEPEWGGSGLCAEAGAVCEATKLDQRIVATVCVSRLAGDAPIMILTPCGICQERLYHWGGEVEVAVPLAHDPTRWQMKYLREIQPYYWVNAFNSPASPPDAV